MKYCRCLSLTSDIAFYFIAYALNSDPVITSSLNKYYFVKDRFFEVIETTMSGVY